LGPAPLLDAPDGILARVDDEPGCGALAYAAAAEVARGTVGAAAPAASPRVALPRAVRHSVLSSDRLRGQKKKRPVPAVASCMNRFQIKS
jgi:hypothetical protein